MDYHSYMNLKPPTINLNGTSGNDLVSEFRVAADYIHEAIQKVTACTVHGRDYPDQEVCYQSRDRKQEILKQLHAFYEELAEVSCNLAEQQRLRKR
jgi:hypothetical protein